MISSAERAREWCARTILGGAVLVLFWACGDSNLFGPGGAIPSQMTINQPAEGSGAPANDSLLVDVTLSPPAGGSGAGITSVLFEGVSSDGGQEVARFEPEEVTFDPPNTGQVDVTEYLQPTGAATDVSETYIRVTATDAAENVLTDSVRIQLGAPGLTFVSPENGDQVVRGGQIGIALEASDEVGVASLRVEAGDGGMDVDDLPLEEQFSPAQPSAELNGTVDLPDQTGSVELVATAVNAEGTESTTSISIEVVEEAAEDNEAPSLRVQVDMDGAVENDTIRVEAADLMRFNVRGRDNSGGSGVATVGVSVSAVSGDRGTSDFLTRSVDFDRPRSGTVDMDVEIPVSELEDAGVLDLTEAPDPVDLEIFAYMVDGEGNCAAAVSSDEPQSLECADENGNTVASGIGGQERVLLGVSGQTVALPGGNNIADAVVDTVRNYLVLSNVDQSRLNVFDLGSRTFLPEIQVGSKPWGLTFSRTDPDTLYVANSGGTNISLVDMVTGTEDIPRRIQTPNAVLFDAQENETEAGYELTVEIHGFSDRPQFIAQDSQGELVYSTRPTSAASLGTIRLATPPAAGRPDTEVILYTSHGERTQSEQNTAVDRLDAFDLDAFPAEVRDHVPGDEGATLSESINPAESNPTAQAIDRLRGAGSDARAFPGTQWDVESVGLSDTTFISASGDGTRVAIGEGATGPTGRIIMYDAATQEVSDLIPVTDLVENAAERVVGVDLNYDGTMGVARGDEALYFFTPDLRLQGEVDMFTSGAGAALHPLHIDGPTGTDPNVAIAFAGTGDRTIEIFDTRHFARIGSVTIRDRIAGQIRAVMPPASAQPAGVTSCTTETTTIGTLGDVPQVFDGGGSINAALDDECVIVRLTGVTAGGGVVVVDVTKADVIRHHPDNPDS